MPKRRCTVSNGRNAPKRSNSVNVKNSKKKEVRKTGRLVINDNESDDDDDDGSEDRDLDNDGEEESDDNNEVGGEDRLVNNVDDEEEEDVSSDEEENHHNEENEVNVDGGSDCEDALPEMNATAGRGNNRNGKRMCMLSLN